MPQDDHPPGPIHRRPLDERVDDLSRFAFDLIKRANNIERKAGKQEDLYYRLHGQLKVMEDSVLRLLTPLGTSYAAAVKRAEPYDRIIEELPDMRTDTIALVKQAVTEQRQAYVLVNNRSEGSARSPFKRW